MEDQALHDDRYDVVVGHQGPDIDVIELPERDLVDAGEGARNPELFPERSADQPGDVGVDDEDEGAAGAHRLRQGVDDPCAQFTQRRVPGPVVPVDGEGEAILTVLQIQPPQRAAVSEGCSKMEWLLRTPLRHGPRPSWRKPRRSHGIGTAASAVTPSGASPAASGRALRL